MKDNNLNANPVASFRKFKSTKKTLSDFIDSFDKLNRILEEKIKFGKNNYKNTISNSKSLKIHTHLPEKERTEDQFKKEEKKESSKINLKPISEPKKDMHSQSTHKNDHPNEKPINTPIQNSSSYTLPEEFRKHLHALQNSSSIPLPHLLSTYSQILFYFQKVKDSLIYHNIETQSENNNYNDHINEEVKKMEELRTMEGIQKQLRKQMAKEFLQCLSISEVKKCLKKNENIMNNEKLNNYTLQNESYRSDHNPNIQNVQKDKKDGKEIQENGSMNNNDLVRQFIQFFTDEEINYLFIKYLIYRKNKLTKILNTIKCNFFILEEIIRKEVVLINTWFGLNLINKNKKNLNLFKNFIFSLLRKKLNEYNNNQVADFIEEKKKEIEKNGLNCEEVIAKMVLGEIVREMRETRLARDGILEL